VESNRGRSNQTVRLRLASRHRTAHHDRTSAEIRSKTRTLAPCVAAE
jgi:hypothetical protein